MSCSLSDHVHRCDDVNTSKIYEDYRIPPDVSRARIQTLGLPPTDFELILKTFFSKGTISIIV